MAITFDKDIASPAHGFNPQWFEFSSSTSDATVCEITITAPSFSSVIEIYPNTSGVFVWNPLEFVKSEYLFQDAGIVTTSGLGDFNDDFNIDFLTSQSISGYDDDSMYKEFTFDFVLSFASASDESEQKVIVFLKSVAQKNDGLTISSGTNETGRLMPIPMTYFDGYPFEFSFWDGTSVLRELVSDGVDHNVFGNLNKVTGQKGVYLKWLSKAGYSYWLFDCVHQDNLSSSSKGFSNESFSSFNEVNELGRDLSRVRTLRAVVSNDDWLTVETLLTSPEVYQYNQEKGDVVNWSTGFDKMRVGSFNSKVINTKKSMREIIINLELPNPSSILLT